LRTPCLWQVEYSTTLRNRPRKHGNPVPPPLRERLARGNHIPLSPRGSVMPKKSHSPSVTARRCFLSPWRSPSPSVTASLCDTEEVSLPFRHREAMFFYRRGGLGIKNGDCHAHKIQKRSLAMTRKDAASFPFSHREPADFAGVAASVSKTEIATLTKYKSVRSQ